MATPALIWDRLVRLKRALDEKAWRLGPIQPAKKTAPMGRRFEVRNFNRPNWFPAGASHRRFRQHHCSRQHRRAAAAGGDAPATSKAQVVVLIDLEHLTDTLRGAGTTLTGQDLSPATVRKLACDASIIPIVLGSQGQPLDVGRTKRLVTPALLAALWVRDKHCTFPGCSRPANWCVAHHVIHWNDGGPTALTNLALLCQHHHTYVHRWDLTATITTLGVTWHT